MLLGFLLIVYGPAYLGYMVLRRPSSVVDRRISNSLNFDDIVVSLNLWIAIMFVCVIAFFQIVDRLATRSARSVAAAISGRNLPPLSGVRAKPWSLLIVILALGLFMAWVSEKEQQLTIIVFFRSRAARSQRLLTGRVGAMSICITSSSLQSRPQRFWPQPLSGFTTW